LLASTFIGVFLDSTFPSYRPKEYVADISDGNIAILYSIPEERESEIRDMLSILGAQSITLAERQTL